MAAPSSSTIPTACASALAYGHSAVGCYVPSLASEFPVISAVPTMTLAPRETGLLLTATVTEHVTSSRAPWPPDKRAAEQPPAFQPRSESGQVVSCGDLVIISATRADPTEATDLLGDDGDDDAINAICFRRTRRDMEKVVEVSDPAVPIICLPTKLDRQLTACETSFTLPTPAVAGRIHISTHSESRTEAEWNIYLPDGRSIQEVSDHLAQYKGYGLGLGLGLAMTPVHSLCYGGLTHEDGKASAVVCRPADGDPFAYELGMLML
jgi:hypothetical protein